MTGAGGKSWVVVVCAAVMVAGCSGRTKKPRQPVVAAPTPAAETDEGLKTDHTGPITALAYSSDGATLATAAEDRAIKLWNLGDRALRRTLTGHTGLPLVVDFGPGGHTLYSRAPGEAILWDLTSGDALATWPARPDAVAPYAFDAAGDRVAVAPDGGAILVFDVATAAVVCRLETAGDVASLIFGRTAADGLFSGDARGLLVKWNLDSCGEPQPVPTLPAVGQNVLARSPDGDTVALGGQATIRLYDGKAGQLVQSVSTGAGLNVLRNLRFAGAGYLVANRIRVGDAANLMAATGDTVIWAVGDQARSGAIVWQQADTWAVDVDPGQQTIAVADGSTVRLVRFPAASRRTPALVVQSGHTRAVTDLAFSADGATLLSADGQSVSLWDMRSRRQLRHWSVPASRVAFADGGKLAVASGGAGWVWETATGRLVDTLESGQGILGMAASSRLPLAAINQGGKLVFRNLRTRTVSTSVPINVSPLAFDRAGGRIAFVNGLGQVTVYDQSAPNPVTFPDTGRVLSDLAFSDDGAVVVASFLTGAGPAVMAWEIASGAQVAALGISPATQVQSVAVAGDRLYAQTAAGLTVWNWRTGARVTERGMSAVSQGGEWLAASALAVTAERGLVAVGQRNGDISLWSPELAPVGGLNKRVQPVVAVAPAPSGGDVVLVDAGGNVVRWGVKAADAVTPLRQTPLLHPASAAWSQRALAVGGMDVVELIDPKTGAAVAKLAPISGRSDTGNRVHSLGFTGDGRQLWAANAYRAVVRTLSTDRTVASLDHGKLGLPEAESITGAAASGDGRWLAVGSGQPMNLFGRGDSGQLVIWDVANGRLGSRFQLPRSVMAVAVDPAGTLVVGSRADGHLQFWNLASGDAVADIATLPARSLVFSPDGRRLASGDLGGLVTVWDVAARKAVGQLNVGAPVASVRFAADGKRLWVGADNGVTSIIDAGTAALVAQIAAPGGVGHVTFTPDGYYWASQSALDAVSFRHRGRALAFDQLDLYFNRPDIVLERLGQGDDALKRAFRHAHQRRLRRLGSKQLDQIAWDQIPEVQVLSHRVVGGVLRAEIEARGSRGLQSLQVWVNGVPAYSARGKPLGGTDKQGTAAIEVPLSHGNNELQISVTDVAGVESFREVFAIDHSAGPAPGRRLFVLAIGVSNYKNREINLRYAAKDAGDFAQLMADVGQFDQVSKLVITDAQARKETILGQGRKFLAAAGLEDQVVLFVAGHGLRDQRFRYYFATHDIDVRAPAARGLSFDDLESLVDGLAARRRMILIDTCYSGELDIGAPAAPPRRTVDGIDVDSVRPRAVGLAKNVRLPGAGHRRAIDVDFASLKRGTGAAIVASSSGYEVAFESPQWKNGAFTYTLLEGVRGRRADADGNGAISVSELRDYAGRRVRELTDGMQAPMARHHNILLDFDLSRAVRPTVMKTPGRDWNGVAVNSTGTLVATVSRSGHVTVRDRAKQTDRRLAAAAAQNGLVAFSPDDRYLAVASMKGARLFDLGTGKARPLGAGSTYNPILVFSGDSRRVATIDGKQVVVHDTASGAEVRRTADVGSVYALAGNRLVSAGQQGEIAAVDLLSGKTRILARGLEPFAVGAISADGELLVTANDDRVQVRNTASGQLVRTIAVGSRVSAVALSADGKRLLVATFDNQLRLWSLATGSERGWFAMPEHLLSLGQIGFAGDGTQVYATAAGELLLWKL